MFKKLTIKNSLILIIILISTLLLFANTSPLFQNCYWQGMQSSSIDSMIIAKGWSLGMIPYKELFGIQGPLLYLIQMFGWLIGGRTGLFCIQVCCITIACFLMKNVLNLLNKRNHLMFFLFLWIATMGAGNITEIYTIPFIAYTIQTIIKIINQNERNIDWFLLGISIGFIAGIDWFQLTIPLLFLIGILVKREYRKSIGKKLAICTIGIFVVIIPSIIYFYGNHAFKDLIYGNILYPFYSALHTSAIKQIWIHKLIKAIPAFLLILVGYFCRKQKNNELEIINFYGGIGLFIFLLLRGVDWNYYCIEILFIPLLFCGIEESFSTRTVRILNIFTVILLLGIFITPLKNYISEYKLQCWDGNYQNYTSSLQKWTKSEFKNTSDKKVLLAVDVSSDIYLITNKIPAYRFFSNQTDMTYIIPEIGANVYNYVLESKNPWLLVNGKGWLQEVIGHYKFIGFLDNDNDIALYQYDNNL